MPEHIAFPSLEAGSDVEGAHTAATSHPTPSNPQEVQYGAPPKPP